MLALHFVKTQQLTRKPCVSVLSAAAGPSGLLRHHGGKRQEGHHRPLGSHRQEPAECPHGDPAGQPLGSRQ